MQACYQASAAQWRIASTSFSCRGVSSVTPPRGAHWPLGGWTYHWPTSLMNLSLTGTTQALGVAFCSFLDSPEQQRVTQLVHIFPWKKRRDFIAHLYLSEAQGVYEHRCTHQCLPLAKTSNRHLTVLVPRWGRHWWTCRDMVLYH